VAGLRVVLRQRGALAGRPGGARRPLHDRAPRRQGRRDRGRAGPRERRAQRHLEARSAPERRDGTTGSVLLERTGENRFEGRYALEKEGVALGTLELADGKFVTLPPVALPYSPEFEPSPDPQRGERLLRRLAEESGGMSGVAAADLWRGARAGHAWRVVTREVIIAALLALLVEIAVRRLQLAGLIRLPAFLGRWRVRRRVTAPAQPSAADVPATPVVPVAPTEAPEAKTARSGHGRGATPRPPVGRQALGPLTLAKFREGFPRPRVRRKLAMSRIRTWAVLSAVALLAPVGLCWRSTLPGLPTRPVRPPAEVVVRARARFLDPNCAPIPGVVLRLGTYALAGSDSDGQAELEFHSLHETETKFDLTAEREGFMPRSFELRARNGRSYEIGDVRMEFAGAIAGCVTDIDGAPIAGARVGVLYPAGRDAETLRRVAALVFSQGPRQYSDACGRFRVSSVEPGPRVLIAEHHRGYLRAISNSIDVRAGETSPGVVLVLEPIPAAERLDGLVLAADESPLPRAELRWTLHGPHRSDGMHYADEFGRFTFILRAGETLDLSAHHRMGLEAPALAANLVGGACPVVLHLERWRTVALEVRDAHGARVGRFRMWTTVADDHDSNAPEQRDDNGELRLPRQPFALNVMADGFRAWSAQALDPDCLPDPYVVHLERMPVLAGHVRDAAGPVSNAQVSVWHFANPGGVINGFPSRVYYSEMASTTSGAQGAFALTLREATQVIVRCTYPDFAPWELGPLAYDPKDGLADMDVVLEPGGAIEGRVVAAPGERAAGTIVAFSRGDGQPFTVRVGEDGAFRVRAPDTGALDGGTGRAGVRTGRVLVRSEPVRARIWLPSECTVTQGETTHVDLEPAHEEPTLALDGLVTIDDVPASGWLVEPADAKSPHARFQHGCTDLFGHFVLEVPHKGPTSFSLTARGGPFDGVHFVVSEFIPPEASGGARTFTRPGSRSTCPRPAIPANPG
jgi:hypothetical protein